MFINKPVIQSRLLALGALVAMMPLNVQARVCKRVMEKKPRAVSALDLIRPEVEAKMRPPNKEIFEKMHEVWGEEFKLKGPGGRTYNFEVAKAPRLMYVDTFYDIISDDGELVLLNQGALLRRRERYHWNEKKEKWVFDRVVFHSKNEALRGDALYAEVSARNEIRGQQSKKLKKFKRRTDEMLTDATDPAIAYARKLAGRNGDFVPVMRSVADRSFYHVNALTNRLDVPNFTLSLDKIEHEALIRAEGDDEAGDIKAKERTVELELSGAELDNFSRRTVAVQMAMLNELKSQLSATYNLTPIFINKYKSGAMMTIFRP